MASLNELQELGITKTLVIARPSKVAVARQPSLRLRASIKQSAKSAALSRTAADHRESDIGQ
jgi:hypothetical protein